MGVGPKDYGAPHELSLNISLAIMNVAGEVLYVERTSLSAVWLFRGFFDD